MTTKRVTERTVRPFAGARVDRDAGVIHNVLICGFQSANGRDYPAAVFRRDYAVYEGRPVNADHGRESTVDRRIGWFENVRPGDDGRPRGNFHMLRTHPLYERVMEAAERNPALYGFSHVAMCEATLKGGREVVEAIRSVESVDLVAEPATTRGLFEGKTVSMTLREYLDKLAPRLTLVQVGRAKHLAEMDGMGDLSMPATATDPADGGTDPDEAITEAFRQAMHAQVDALMESSHSLEEFITKIKALAKAHGKITGSDTGGDSNEVDGTPKESKKADPFVVWDECKTAGFDPTKSQLKALAAMPNEADRALFIKESKDQLAAVKRESEAPTSRSRGKANLTPEVKQPATDGKSFAESVTR